MLQNLVTYGHMLIIRWDYKTAMQIFERAHYENRLNPQYIEQYLECVDKILSDTAQGLSLEESQKIKSYFPTFYTILRQLEWLSKKQWKKLWITKEDIQQLKSILDEFKETRRLKRV